MSNTPWDVNGRNGDTPKPATPPKQPGTPVK